MHRRPGDQTVLTWVAVSFGGVADAVELVKSLGIDPPIDVIICANRMGDAAEAHAAFEGYDNVRVLEYEDNPGYLPALQRTVAQIDTTRPVVLSNCDLVADPGCVQALLDCVAEYPGAGSLAPSILGRFEKDQNPFLMTPPSVRWLQFLARVHRFALLADALMLIPRGRNARLRRGVLPGQTMFAGHGSCIVLTSKYFSEGGSLEYPFPLFGEEMWVGSECARLGLAVRYCPSATLHHHEHASTGRRRRGRIAQTKYEGLRWWARRAVDLGWD